MILDVNSPPRTTRMLTEVRRLLINDFQNPRSEDQYMNEMIEIRQKTSKYFWEID